MADRRSLQTILFTDIVGSTKRASEVGDRRWSALLEEHHARARREIRRFGGREVKATGDGFLAAFPRPAHALQCAWAIREAVREVGLEVRSGIHIGAVERHGRDLGGIVVHVGARIASAGAPGQILLSNAVREAEMGSGFRFEDRGRHELKGAPGEWRLFSLESLPSDAASPSRSWIPPIPRERRTVALGMIAVLLVASAAAYLLTRGPGDSAGPEVAMAAPGIAVLPFRVGSEDLKVWREGMVDVLSTNLDGIPGFRAIDSRTVLARWRENVDGDGMPDTPTALEVARRTGARYAVLGSVVLSGEELRLVAELYDVESGRPLSRGQVDGAADSIFGLVDRLTIQLMRAIVDTEERLAAIHLARATTTSLPALRAYLEGEIDFRRGEFDRAIDAYERAVETDSTFALAWSRMSIARGWSLSSGGFSEEEALERALRHIDRLPEREALLVRGLHDLRLNNLQGLETLRLATRRYPEDAMGWFVFGDMIFHRGGVLLFDSDDALHAFERTIEIDPTFALAYEHAISAIMRAAPDSARVTGLVRAYERLEHDPWEISFIPAIAWGDSSARAAGIASLDSLSRARDCPPCPMFFGLLHFSHPRFLNIQADLIRMALPGSPVFVAPHMVRTLLFRGQVAAALEAVTEPVDVDAMLYLAHVSGYDIPIDRLELALAWEDAGGQPPDSIFVIPPGGPSPLTGYVFRGAWALERARYRDFQEALDTIRSLEADRRSNGDSAAATYADGAAQALEGYRAWREGRTREADELLESARQKTTGQFMPVSWVIRWWEARLALEREQPERAARFFHSLSHGESLASDPMATLELARIQEQLGRYDEARANYEFFALAFRDADPELQPLVAEARQAAARLGKLKRE